jgi:thiol-disulfide isomerase/thioredoxin
MRGSVKAVGQDLMAGLVAIVAVVGTAIYTQFVGSDLRALFGMSGIAFLLAGLARPGRAGSPAWRQGLVVSLPGLLGDVALIVNNGWHRLDIPIAITLTSIASAITGVAIRRLSTGTRGRAMGLAAVFTVALALWVTIGLPRFLAHMSMRWETRTAPSLRFSSLDGATVRVPDPQGRVVLLAFWATWCLPCRWELPEIARLQERFATNPHVAVWAVDVGWGTESPRRARIFLERMGLAIPVAFDSGFTAQALGVHALPAIALVDGAGRLRLMHSGYDRSEDIAGRLSAAITRVLEESGSPRVPAARPTQ